MTEHQERERRAQTREVAYERDPNDNRLTEGGIGDTNAGTGTMRPWDDVGVGGVADVGGQGNMAGTDSIRTGDYGKGTVWGTRQGNVGPTTGVDTGGPNQANQAGVEALSAPVGGTGRESLGSTDMSGTPTLVEESMARQGSQVADGANANAALGVAGIPTSEGKVKEGDPGTGNLGAAVGADLGAGLGKTQGRTSPGSGTQGEVSGIGGTTGSGEGTGHLTDIGPTESTPGSGGVGSGS